MISVTRLYLGTTESGDALRYGHGAGPRRRAPVVVWNATRLCNLSCRHCYGDATADAAPHELSTDEARTMIGQLAAYGCPVLLVSGGEPLLRPELPELAALAVSSGMRVAISSNGTMLDDAMAHRLKDAGIAYIGISLDGSEQTHDTLRGRQGAHAAACAGLRAARRAGLKCGIRFTLMRQNADDIPAIFDLVEREDIPRACFYHLVYAGRGADLAADDLDHAQARRAVDLIIDRVADMHRQGPPREILTVDNHADGAYLYLRMKREGNARADDVLDLLRRTGGNGSGETIGCIGWDGTVYPDQFWRTHALGSVREKPFGDIWGDPDQPLLRALRDKRRHVTGKCVTCRFLDICGGNFRARAEAATGETWGVDPACYLTDAETAH